MGMLTQARVERLMSDLSGRVRAETAAIVAGEFASGDLSETDQRIARDIIAVLARDVEIQVREAVAEHLKSCPFLPREVALELAYDIETVAVPILECSCALNDEDLIAVIRVGSTNKQVAIARRLDVRANVTDVLIETGSPEVITAVLANITADISDDSLSTVVDHLGYEQAIQALLVDRPKLPITAIESLIQQVSDELAARLILKHDIPPRLVSWALTQGREGAIARLIVQSDSEGTEISSETLANIQDAITPTLLLRCLCQGNVRFVEVALATLAEIPIENAATLMYDPGPLGLQSLFRKARLPDFLLRAFRTAVAVHLDDGNGGRTRPAAEVTHEILERLTHEYREVSPGNLEHVLAEFERMARNGGSLSSGPAVH